jgi:hypothetical protein
MRGQFHFYPVARPEPDKILYRRSRRMRRHFLLVFQNQTVCRARQKLHDSSNYGRVRTHGPFAVTATQCSKCAE